MQLGLGKGQAFKTALLPEGHGIQTRLLQVAVLNLDAGRHAAFEDGPRKTGFRKYCPIQYGSIEASLIKHDCMNQSFTQVDLIKNARTDEHTSEIPSIMRISYTI